MADPGDPHQEQVQTDLDGQDLDDEDNPLFAQWFHQGHASSRRMT